MPDAKSVRSEELETAAKTSGDFPENDNEGTSRITEKATGTGSEIASETEEDYVDQGRNSTPFEISRLRYYESEKKKNDNLASVYKVLKYLIPIVISIIIGLLAFFGGIWAYKLNNISEPIGGLKVEVQYLKENISELKTEVNKIQEKTNTKMLGQ